jgi:4-hydroxybenzoate polyprenyltransferase
LSWLSSLLVHIYLLELVGASVITALGWTACLFLQLPWIPSAPLWFAGYLFVYNLDRLYLDPADRLNTPLRVRWADKLRLSRFILILSSGCVLVLYPLATHRPWLPVALGCLVVCCFFYSRPIPWLGFRLKDLSSLKSVFLPFFIACILVIWPCWEAARSLGPLEWLVFCWCFCALTINSLVFDYRDIAGDSRYGNRTIPTQLGPARTLRLLVGLAVMLIALSALMPLHRFAVAIALGGVSMALLSVVKWRPHPLGISLLADVLLLVPALVELVR